MLVWLTVLACSTRTAAPLPVDLEPVVFSASGSAPLPDEWWTAFGDDALDARVREALGQNFTVQAAFARLLAAEAVVQRERAPLFPSFTGFADSSIGTDDPFGGVQRVPVELGVQASYEIDLWGRIRANLEAEVQRREATRADAEAAALSLSVAVARAWVGIAATQEQLVLLDEQIVANQGMAAVVEARFRNGVVRQADALRQERLLEQTRAEQVSQRTALEVQTHQLAVLLGKPPKADVGALPARLPPLLPLPDAGVPLELVRRRPDVQSAERALRAADAEVAVAVANQFPRLSLGASTSNAPGSAEALLQGWVSSLGASLVVPLLAAGERRAEVRRTRALLDAEVAEYGAVLLVALQEVEDGLTRDRRQQELVDNIDRQVALAQQTAAGLQAQYTGGLDVSYLDVLTAQTTAQQLRRAQISARRQHLELRIDLYRALAGGITPQPEASE